MKGKLEMLIINSLKKIRNKLNLNLKAIFYSIVLFTFSIFEFNNVYYKNTKFI